MAFLNEQEKQRIADAVKQAEKGTSGELVTVVFAESDPYLYIPLLWASLIALLVPTAFLLYAWLTGSTGWGDDTLLDFVTLHGMQVFIFIALAILFRWSPLKMRLVPKGVKQKRARWMAYEQFFTQGLHLTRGRTGVLLFVSVGEHYVEIIADKGINDEVTQETWQSIVDDFVQHVRSGDVTQGLLAAVQTCGELLAEHFPPGPDDINELPDRPVGG